MEGDIEAPVADVSSATGAVAVAVPVASSQDEGGDNAPLLMVRLHHRRVPLAVVMVACGLITFFSVARMMIDG